jgi:hypothetical protein
MKYKKTPALQVDTHQGQTVTEEEGDLTLEEEKDTEMIEAGSGSAEKPEKTRKTKTKKALKGTGPAMVSFLLFGAWVDDKVVITCDLEMYED